MTTLHPSSAPSSPPHTSSINTFNPTATQPSTTTPPNTTSPYQSFPPFYTLQPNLSTRTAQLNAWSTLLTTSCASTRTWTLNTSSALFENRAINRRLAVEDVKVLFAYMISQGAALAASSSSSSQQQQQPQQQQRRWIGTSAPAKEHQPGPEEIHPLYHSLDSWATMLLNWVEETGQRGAVLTVFEMTEGDAARGREWEGMPEGVFRRVVDAVVGRGRGAVFGGSADGGGGGGEGGGVGVKFY